MREAEPMTKNASGSFTCEVSLGANRWEMFYLTRNSKTSKKIYPAVHKSWKDMPCVGPHKGRDPQTCWLLSGSPSFSLPGEDEGVAGSRYEISFTPGEVKRLTWDKLEGEPASFVDTGKYFITGSWACFEPEEMKTERPGLYSFDVQKSMPLKFQFVRNEDKLQGIFPDVDPNATGNLYSLVAPVGDDGQGRFWEIDARPS